MPAYDYDCAACGRRFEVVHGVHAEGPTSCPLCGNGPVRKAISAAAVHYKGSGWAKKERRITPTTAGSSSKSTDGSSSDGEGSAGTEGGAKPDGDSAKEAAPTEKSTTGPKKPAGATTTTD